MKRIFAIILMTVFFVAFGAGYLISVPRAGACPTGCACIQANCEAFCNGQGGQVGVCVTGGPCGSDTSCSQCLCF